MGVRVLQKYVEPDEGSICEHWSIGPDPLFVIHGHHLVHGLALIPPDFYPAFSNHVQVLAR